VPASVPTANASLATEMIAAIRSLASAPIEQKDQSDATDNKHLEWACPREIFLLIVHKWILHGSFVDPHLLAPRYLEWLKGQTRSLKGYKKDCDNFSHFDSRELGP